MSKATLGNSIVNYKRTHKKQDNFFYGELGTNYKNNSQKIDHPHFGNENKLEHFINTTNQGGRRMTDGPCLTNVQKTEIL